MTTPSQGSLKAFSALIGVTSVVIFLQAVIAGEFVSQRHRGSWIDIHGIVADVVVALALASMIFVIVKLRSSRLLLIGSIVLLVLVVIQVFIGHLITDSSQDWLIGIHVPLAFIIFGLAIWLPIQSVAVRRGISRAV